ncbi:MAG: methionyl-tRNA formyltransferase [Deltaproteobacteria bacterium]|nr:methionyl-tRNA formyltransferase [Deltaproteobacteria bacterium]MBW2400025.1 methionyl-tRNA formyltransferase [Deltaproteobacteria bacterium]MBW2667574.1 methionyl-tRNA formyltransferase [Deltaproteobacteria bacterium]
MSSLKLAVFGQAAFGRDVLVRLAEAGHSIVGVYTPPEGRRPDPLAAEAESSGLRLFRHARFRRKGAPITELVDEHRALGADLNVLAFVTVILPSEIVDGPPHGSLCFHPSLLPKFRGGNALAWQIIEGEAETGVSVFRPDAGVDTGPLVVQRGGVAIRDHHTAASLYFDELYEPGVAAMVEAVGRVADGSARYQVQDEAAASHQGLVDDAIAKIDWSRDVVALDRLIRGCDPNPGALALHGGEPVRLFDGRRVDGTPSGPPGTIAALEDGRMIVDAAGGRLSIGKVRVGSAAKVAAAESTLEIGDRLG